MLTKLKWLRKTANYNYSYGSTFDPTGAIKNPPTFKKPRKKVIVPIGQAPPQYNL